MIEITRNSAIELLREIVAEYGKGHLYRPEVTEDRIQSGNMCYYVHNGPTNVPGGTAEDRPGCIVGVFMSRLGVPLSAMESMEGKSAGQMLSIFENRMLIRSEYGVSSILDTVQSNQDLGIYWGDALRRAEHHRDRMEMYIREDLGATV